MHFQTTDVHWPWAPVAPFAGLFVDPEVRETYFAVGAPGEIRGPQGQVAA